MTPHKHLRSPGGVEVGMMVTANRKQRIAESWHLFFFFFFSPSTLLPTASKRFKYESNNLLVTTQTAKRAFQAGHDQLFEKFPSKIKVARLKLRKLYFEGNWKRLGNVWLKKSIMLLLKYMKSLKGNLYLL
ncbi:Retrovirus-related Pol polyprotein from transposon TNT 1-94, partial [Fusarium oxysporum f. sp. albedinis]